MTGNVRAVRFKDQVETFGNLELAQARVALATAVAVIARAVRAARIPFRYVAVRPARLDGWRRSDHTSRITFQGKCSTKGAPECTPIFS
jgi:hypothetical protein